MKQSDSTLQYWLPALLLTAVLCAGPLLIFRPVPEKKEIQMEQKRFTVMMKDFPEELKYWEKIGDSHLFVRPSAIGYSGLLHGESSLNEYVAFSTDQLSAMERRLARHPAAPEMRKLPDFPAELLPEPAALPAPVLIRQPLFRLNGTKTISGIVCGIPDSGKPEKSTVLAIAQKDAMYPPSVQVVQSCGIPAFDLAAQKAIFLPAIQQKQLCGTVTVEWPSAPEEKK